MSKLSETNFVIKKRWIRQLAKNAFDALPHWESYDECSQNEIILNFLGRLGTAGEIFLLRSNALKVIKNVSRIFTSIANLRNNETL